MTRYHDDVAAALRAVRVEGETRYSWQGRRSRPLRASIEAELDAPARRRYLVAALTEVLYASFYCHGRPVAARSVTDAQVAADPRLTAALSDANAGRGSWDPGWTVERLDGARAMVRRGGLRARVALAVCRAPTGTARPGTAVRVPLPKELPELSPGFFSVVGDVPFDGSEGVVRVYWSVTAPGAPVLVRALTRRLNPDEIPFRLKVVDHPARFERCDAAILYLPVEHFERARQALRRIAAECARSLQPATPAFTHVLARGVGLAEDVLGGESFGMRRCGLLADGLVRARERGIERLPARLEAVAARFAEDGVEFDAPYLEPALAGRHVL